MNSESLSLAFTEDAPVRYRGAEALLRTISVGVLLLPSGRLIACDPIAPVGEPPFAVRLQPGRYSVTLHAVEQDNHQSSAFALVRISGKPTVRWEPATREGSDTESTYSVDSGTGCFMDPVAAAVLDRKMSKNEFFYERIINEMADSNPPGWRWTNLMISRKNPANLIAFTTGAGDGTYPSYWGRAEDGTITCLLNDFLLLDDG
jgi:hypothetical protein